MNKPILIKTDDNLEIRGILTVEVNNYRIILQIGNYKKSKHKEIAEYFLQSFSNAQIEFVVDSVEKIKPSIISALESEIKCKIKEIEIGD